MPEIHGTGRQRFPEMPADWHRLIGFGSFGKPAVLLERLQRILARYENTMALGTGAGLSDCVTQALMESLNDQLRISARHSATHPVQVRGFCLYRKGGRIVMRVLTPQGWSHPLHSVV